MSIVAFPKIKTFSSRQIPALCFWSQMYLNPKTLHYINSVSFSLSIPLLSAKQREGKREREAVISPSPTLIGSRCWCWPGQGRKSFGKFSGLSLVFLGPGLGNQSALSTGWSWGWSKPSYWPEIQTWASGADVLGKFRNPSRPTVKEKWKHLLAQLDSDQSLF